MSRKLVAPCLCLMAAFSVSVVVTHTALAQEPVFTVDSYPADLDGFDVKQNQFTLFGATFACSSEAATYDSTLHSPSSTLTVIPSYNDCSFFVFEVTVTMNGCVYEFHLEEWDYEHEGLGSVDFVCPPGQEVTFNSYHAEDPNHNMPLCVVHIPPQHLEGVKYTVVTGAENSTDVLTIEGNAESLDATRTEGFCSEFTISHGIFDLNITFRGTDEEEEHNGLRISE